jgi:hypothetical protein
MKKNILTAIVILGVLGLIAFLMNNQKKTKRKRLAQKNASVSKIETVKTEEVLWTFQ